MLQIKKICKQYKTGDLVQDALDGVTLNFRDNEFVAVLGPSGSGKTTLLNIIGGLDRYDSGDLIINGISTKKYKDRDWDSYRNHTIGFVFQSYNLIPHQSILANVELALTISGVSRSERRNRAKKALERVGLGNQTHKKPNQMSGGQMQRVAIARALVNNPDILLADEPTGALDTETSIQVMELLKEVAKDRLVIMVTHNPELAEEYATRIVKLRDGRITDDSEPFEVDESKLAPTQHKNMGKASMSFFTSLALSFNNLRTKKVRTFLTSFAGSIGIIGIALILSLSNGVSTYINDIQKSTMSSYPISIEAQSMDIESLMKAGENNMDKQLADADHALDGVYLNGSDFERASSMVSSINKNNLTLFKKYLDNPDSEIHKYIGENGIVYSFDTKFGVYTFDPEGVLVKTDGSTLSKDREKNENNPFDTTMPAMPGMESVMPSSNNFEEILPDQNTSLVSDVVKNAYDVLYGSWPSAYDEVVLVLNKHNEISASVLYKLGVLPSADYNKLMDKIDNGEEVVLESQKWSYDEICKKQFYLVPDCDTYVKNENGTFDYVANDTEKMKELTENSFKLKIVGVVRPSEDTDNLFVTSPVGYTKALTDYIIDYTNKSEVVKAQQANTEINVLNGYTFSPADDATKIADAKAYINKLGISDKASLFKSIIQKSSPAYAAQIGAMNETQLAAMFDEYMKNPEDESMLNVYNTYISSGSYEDNMKSFGVVNIDTPKSISIYSDSFEDKDAISECIENYNKDVDENDKIRYTDYVGLLMSSITTIINVISYVLIAFVAVSLVVSSIMIGIITYISVLERTKEIGILRAMGASKHNISQVFNAETFIVGLLAGVIGVGITLLILIPGNAIIHSVTGSTDVNAELPLAGAVILIVLSVVLTLIGGLIPSKKAAKKDPVTALRTE